MSRYSRVLELSTFSEEKLAILKSKNVLIIGAGGVCQTVATYLVTNGVENLTICDFDNAEISNLNRQILLTEKHIGEAKADIVKKQLQKRNGEAKIKSLYTKIDKNNIDHVILGFDVVVDAVDNWPTKLVISEACKFYHFILVLMEKADNSVCLKINHFLILWIKAFWMNLVMVF